MKDNNISLDKVGELTATLRGEIQELTGGLTCSAGIACNRMLAKICSDLNKPNGIDSLLLASNFALIDVGQFIVPSNIRKISEFINQLPCRKVSGIGKVTEQILTALNITTCGQIYENRYRLSTLFGTKSFEFLLSCSLGIGSTNTRP